MTIRTRIAPSPTGAPHVGTAYMALFNKVFASSQQGQFILRIEDTDQARSTLEFEKDILHSLKWLGLTWDEGPDQGGPYGPYRQSERRSIYAKYIQILLEKGHAFHCFCHQERLDALRKKQLEEKAVYGYDGHCLHLSSTVIKEKLSHNEPYVIRMKVPSQGHCEIHDILRGVIRIDWQQVDMQVLMKADGMPTYHFANVVDDHLMKITHVIRGEEWINSAPKHQLLYEYFDWEMPVLCHLPLLRNPDKSKLSKRKNPTSIHYYRDMGYLPEALVNYLGRMGWSFPDEREKFSFDEMKNNFDIRAISLGGPVFDQEKLKWLNGCWLRENFTAEEFQDIFLHWLKKKVPGNTLAPLIQERVHILSEVVPLSAFLFSDHIPLSVEQFQHKKMDLENIKKNLQLSIWALDSLLLWKKEEIFSIIKALAKYVQWKLGEFMYPIFIAIAGTATSWSVIESMELLGRDVTRMRLEQGIAILDGLSKKKKLAYEKEFKEFLQLYQKHI